MKTLKLLLTLFLFVGFASCSDDDETDNSTEGDRIVGEWRMQSFSVDGEQMEITECEAQSTIEFFANGNFTSTDFYEDWETEEEECISESYTQKWTYRGNNVYRFTDEGESYDVPIIFSNNNNVFTVTEEDEVGTYSATYIRI